MCVMIRYLEPILINQIAAGEVVERPLNVVKELVENALDAFSTSVKITLHEGGKTLIRIEDNGSGIRSDQLSMALERHATSKIPDSNLFNIQSFGFRGEALPSIASISRLTLRSRTKDSDTAFSIKVEGGHQTQDITPERGQIGTCVEVCDLFYATPVRLKFLKAASTEQSHVLDMIKKIALANPFVDFCVQNEQKTLLDVKAVPTSLSEEDSITTRLKDVLSKDLVQNSTYFKGSREEMSIKGIITLPTYHASASDQHFFVNTRPVRDKILLNALKHAYRDVLEGNRYPGAVLFLTIDPYLVDLNAHPNKTEVRFRDSQMVRNFMVSALEDSLRQTSKTTAPHLSENGVAYFKPSSSFGSSFGREPSYGGSYYRSNAAYAAPLSVPHQNSVAEFRPRPEFIPSPQDHQRDVIATDHPPLSQKPLGEALCQVHGTYIVAQKEDSVILVDQHAAAERLTYERLKKQILSEAVPRLALLLPEMIDLSASEHDLLQTHQGDLNKLGFVFDLYATSLIIKEIPILLEGSDLKSLMKDMLNDLEVYESPFTFVSKQLEKLSSHACHTSIRAHDKLSVPEMNALLRQMEETDFSAQCNHGRPTYVELHLKDIEKLFGRR